MPAKDLTKDSITLHVLSMAAPAAITMLVQAAHQVVTLYFVSRIGTDAIAAVSAGRNDLGDISVLLNQALGLCLVCAVVTVCVIGGLAPWYMSTLPHNDVVIDLGVNFLWWVSPRFALLFPMTVLSATFRGIGVVTRPMLIFTLTIILDAAFAGVLIPGLGLIPALGVEGAGLATTLSFGIGAIVMLAYFRRTEPDIAIQRKLWAPRLAVWRRIFAIGLPVAAELTLMFLMMSAVYVVIRNDGASAQAGFVGGRTYCRTNVGAGNYARVRGGVSDDRHPQHGCQDRRDPARPVATPSAAPLL